MSPATTKMGRCEVCGNVIPGKERGRPRRYCKLRCKESARRERDREAERSARIVSGVLRESSLPACHVCRQLDAVVGSPYPILCRVCSARG